MSKQTIVVDRGRYESMKEDVAHLEELQGMGVDNWEGYVGSSRDCQECGASHPWTHDICVECDEELPDGTDLL